MPIFEYRCNACGSQFEKIQRPGGETPPCPECGATDVRKELSIFSAGQGPATHGPACSGGG